MIARDASTERVQTAAQAVSRGTFCLHQCAVEAENISGGGEGYGGGGFHGTGSDVVRSRCVQA